MNNTSVLPLKIKNLYLLQRIGARVPPFTAVDETAIKNIHGTVKTVRKFFRKKGISNVIIRSAASCEDSGGKTYAGYFESSGAVSTEALCSDIILKYWKINKNKSRKITQESNLFLLIQEFIFSDYSGVLFTQNIYDADKSTLSLAGESAAVTAGKRYEKKAICLKKTGRWMQGEFLSPETKREIEKNISRIEKEFPFGADVELGIKDRDVWIYQARPVIRSADEKILLQEKKRLAGIFENNFHRQEWVKNPFVESLGELSDISVAFYNSLFCREAFRKLLLQAAVIDRQKNYPEHCRVLENIGGRTYYNTTEASRVFPGYRSGFGLLKKTFRVLVFEKLMRKRVPAAKTETMSPPGQSFPWFFLSSLYCRYFMEEEKRKMPFEDFSERLRNTEHLCGARQPRPKSLEPADIEEFKKNYYFWSQSPYELTSARMSDLGAGEIQEKYHYLNEIPVSQDGNKYLNNKISFWLRQKVRWKEMFLKAVLNCRQQLIEKFTEDKFATKGKLSFSASRISGSNFPFPEGSKGKERFIVPGDIDFKDVVFLTKEDSIPQHLNRFIAVKIFPVSRIHLIPRLKGLILQQGNEFSHVAITCREFGIPCRISPHFFNTR